MSSMYDLIAPIITALDNKFNYVRGAIFNAGTATWIKTTYVPTASDGVDGNYCINTSTNIAYVRSAGVWNIVTSSGIHYFTGSGTPSGGLGSAGDIYLDTTNLIIFGPKGASTWPSGTSFEKPLTFSGALSRTGNTITVAVSSITNAMLAGAIDLTTKITGILPIANGGTGQNNKTSSFNALSPITTKGDLITKGSSDNIRLPVGSDTYVLTADSTVAEGIRWLPAGGVANLSSLSAIWGGANNTAISFPIQDVAKYSITGGTIQKVVVITAGTGSCEIDIWKITAASYPPTASNSICGGNYPTITSGNILVDNILTSWSTSISAADTFLFHLRSCTGFTYVSITIYYG